MHISDWLLYWAVASLAQRHEHRMMTMYMNLLAILKKHYKILLVI